MLHWATADQNLPSTPPAGHQGYIKMVIHKKKQKNNNNNKQNKQTKIIYEIFYDKIRSSNVPKDVHLRMAFFLCWLLCANSHHNH